jgi:glutathione S-transferase
VKRAKARFFIDTISTKYVPAHIGILRKGEPHTKYLEGIDALQALLPTEGKWVLGDQFSVADIAIAPFLARSEVSFQNELFVNEGEGKKVLEALRSPKYARFWQYFQDLKTRPSFVKTFDAVRPLPFLLRKSIHIL